MLVTVLRVAWFSEAEAAKEALQQAEADRTALEAKLAVSEAQGRTALEEAQFLSITFNDLQEACFVKDEQVGCPSDLSVIVVCHLTDCRVAKSS